MGQSSKCDDMPLCSHSDGRLAPEERRHIVFPPAALSDLSNMERRRMKSVPIWAVDSLNSEFCVAGWAGRWLAGSGRVLKN